MLKTKFNIFCLILMIVLIQACCSYIDIESTDKRKPLTELGYQSPNITLGTKLAVLEQTFPLPPMAVTSFEVSSSGHYFIVGLEIGPAECYQWAVKVINAYTGETVKTIDQYNNVDFISAKMSYCQMLCMALGGDPFFNNAVNKFYTFDYFSKTVWVVQSDPPFLSATT